MSLFCATANPFLLNEICLNQCYYVITVRHCMAILSKAERPVIVLGSQATLPPTPMEELRKALEVNWAQLILIILILFGQERSINIVR